MLKHLESVWKIHAYERHIPALAIIASPLSLVYRTLSRFKRAFFEWIPGLQIKVRNPVIVIGNITVGGTGKTPLTLWCISKLIESHPELEVISRGYGARFFGSFARRKSGNWDRKGYYGDEVELIAKRYPEVGIRVGKQRGLLLQEIERESKNRLILMDDAYQYWRFERDFNLCVVHGKHWFGNGAIFPAGPLREGIHSIQRANAIIISNPSENSDEQIHKLRVMGIKAPVFCLYSEISRLDDINYPEDEEDLNSKGKDPALPAFAVSGIAHPEVFYEDLRKFGLSNIVGTHSLGDHRELNQTEERRLIELAKISGASHLVMTEKDLPRWKTLDVMPILVARQCIRIEGEMHLLALIENYIRHKA